MIGYKPMTARNGNSAAVTKKVELKLAVGNGKPLGMNRGSLSSGDYFAAKVKAQQRPTPNQNKENPISRDVSVGAISKLSSTLSRASQADFDSLSAMYLKELSALSNALAEKLRRSKYT